ncbi:MAG: hypothetical protein ACYTBJ_25955 [Planctomycetota bacterium]|jgi:hypothetical protein
MPNDPEIITLRELAFASGKSISAISDARATYLKAARFGKHFKRRHPQVIEFLRRCTEEMILGTRPVSERAQRKELLKRGPPPKGPHPEDLEQLPADIRALADRSLNELVTMFGTDTRFKDWLDCVKQLEAVHKTRIESAQKEALLVHVDLIKRGVIDPFDAMSVKLLNDGAKTIARQCHKKAVAGRSIEDVEKYVRKQLSSFIRSLKTTMTRTVREVKRQ